jgi:hypothetical protein
MPQLPIVPDYFITDSSAGPDNKARYSNKHVDELFKFHSNNLTLHGTIRHQHAVTGFQIPGQRSDHHIGPVGNQAVAGRLNGPNCVFELLDVVLMVRPAPIKFDELLLACRIGKGRSETGKYNSRRHDPDGCRKDFFLMISGSSITLMTRIAPWHFGHIRGGPLRRFFLSNVPNFGEIAWMTFRRQ